MALRRCSLGSGWGWRPRRGRPVSWGTGKMRWLRARRKRGCRSRVLHCVVLSRGLRRGWEGGEGGGLPGVDGQWKRQRKGEGGRDFGRWLEGSAHGAGLRRCWLTKGPGTSLTKGPGRGSWLWGGAHA
eukprot:1145008-Pelagomonas_calceolata.AAC.3